MVAGRGTAVLLSSLHRRAATLARGSHAHDWLVQRPVPLLEIRRSSTFIKRGSNMVIRLQTRFWRVFCRFPGAALGSLLLATAAFAVTPARSPAGSPAGSPEPAQGRRIQSAADYAVL